MDNLMFGVHLADVSTIVDALLISYRARVKGGVKMIVFYHIAGNFRGR